MTGNGNFTVVEDDEEIRISSPTLEAAVRKCGYVSGIAGGSFLDKVSGFRDASFGLAIADWILEPGNDAAYRDRLPSDLVYDFNDPVHGRIPKRIVEGPQICTRAGRLAPKVFRGPDFVAVMMDFTFPLAAPDRRAGSRWEQTLVFPAGRRYFLAADRVTTVNPGEALALRMDMPGHIRHERGDTFSEIYLSYAGHIPASEFAADFAPDAKFRYRRSDQAPPPKRFVRACRLRDPATGRDGPWLAGMTLNPSDVSEAWCHQRGYVCLIQEIGGRPVRAGETFGAAYVVGFFDTLAEMNAVYDRYAGHSALAAAEAMNSAASISSIIPGSAGAAPGPAPAIVIGITNRLPGGKEEQRDK
jgi:hypothetical protein